MKQKRQAAVRDGVSLIKARQMKMERTDRADQKDSALRQINWQARHR